MHPIHQGLIRLMRSAVTGEKLSLPEGFSPEAASGLIRAQGLETLAYAGALNCGISREDPAMQKLFLRYLRHTLRGEQQMKAVREVLTCFAANGIDFLPLKGCVMKPLYPAPELRVMGDADILIRKEQYDRIVPLVEQMGFQIVRESLYDYEWQRQDLYLELHHSLITPAEPDLYALFGTGWGRAVPEGEGRYSLSPEDTFLFLFAHMTKHYRNAGIGSRHMLDLYMFRKAHPGLDEGYLTGTMEKLGLGEFYGNILRLLENWFSDGPGDAVTEFITEYIFSGGSFGSMQNRLQTTAARQGKTRGNRLRTLLAMVFPSLENMRKNFPVLKTAPLLLPVLWVWRWIRVLWERPERIGRKLRLGADTTDEKVLARRRALEFVGLPLTGADR